MPDYGWAYVNLDVLKTITGPTGSVQIKIDDYTLSGSQYLAFATASNKVGIGLDFPTTMPTHQLHVKAKAGESAAANFTGDILVSGSAFISGTLRVESIEANTVISSSHLIINDSVIGLGFGDTAGQTGSIGDRGFIFGLAGNLNQAIIWDQTSGSFVMGKVGAQGPEKDNFDITTADLGELRLGQISSSVGVSSSLGEFQNLRIGGATVTSVVNVSGTPANNQVAIWTDGNTIEGDSNLTFDGTTFKVTGPISGSGDLDIVGAAVIEGSLSVSGASTLGDAAADVTKVVGHLSASADVKVAGTTLVGGALSVSGSSTLGGGVTTTTKVVGHLSASADVKIAGTTTIAAALNVSGSTILGGAVTDLTSVIGHLSASTDIKIAGTAIVAGAFNVSGAASFGSTVSGSSSLIIAGDTTLANNVFFAKAGTKRVGIGTVTPNATLELSSSGVHTDGMPKPMFQILHAGAETGGVSDGQPLLYVTGAVPDGFEGRVGINTNNPQASLHVMGTGNTSLMATNEGKVAVGGNFTPSETLAVRTANSQIATFQNGILNADSSADGPFNILFVSGSSDGGGYFGSHHSGSHLHVSGTAHIASLFAGHVSSSANVKVAGMATVAGSLNVSGSSTLGGADTTVTKIVGHLSASADVKVAGTTTIAAALNVSGSSTLGGAVTDSTSVIGHLSASADVKVAGTTIVAGAFNVSGTTTFGNNVSGSGTLIAAGDATLANNSFFADASTKRVGIGTITPNATFEISGSGVHTDGMPKPIFQILHAGAETGGVSDGQPLLFVTGAVPDGFEGRLGINTNNPQASLHVMGAGNTSLMATNEGKVAVGGNFTGGATFSVRTGNSQIAAFQNGILNADDGADGPFNILFVSGSSDGGGYFGSHHSGSHLHVSGTSVLSGVRVHYSSSDSHPLVVTCQPHDYVFGFKTDQGAYSLVLESAAVAGAGRKITVKDVGNNAGSNNITITGSTKSDLIEYSTSTAITGNKRATTVVSDGISRWWVISTHDG